MIKNILAKMKSKKFIIGAVVVVVLVAFFNPFKKGNSTLSVQAFELKNQTLANTIQITGLIESADSSKVSSTLSYNVETVDVKVGDRVSKGQTLATIDTTTILLDIQKAELGAEVSTTSNSKALEDAKLDYETLKSDLENGLNSSVNTAQTSLDNNLRALDDAKKNYSEALVDLDEGENATIKKAQKAVDDARQTWLDADKSVDSAEDSRDEIKSQIESLREQRAILNDQIGTSGSDDAELNRKIAVIDSNISTLTTQLAAIPSGNSATSSVDKAYRAYKDAKIDLEDAVKKADEEIKDQLDAVDIAQTNYDNANKSLRIAQKAAQKQVDTAKDKITSTELSVRNQTSSIDIQKLRKQLTDAQVVAPIEGTVTEVYAKVGEKASGLMFVIENDEALKVKTSIKEYDLPDVQIGMEAIVKTDATEDKEFAGTVGFIAPAAKKAADGSMLSSTNVEFECEVDITEITKELKIGMNARVNIVTESKSNVLAVPYDAILTDENNDSYIYIAEADKNDLYKVKKVVITQGLQTDFFVEVTSNELKEGSLIISSPELVQDGMSVSLVF